MTPSPVWLFEARMPEVEVGKGIDAKPLHLSLQLGLSLENFCNAGE
jgi:hypothetical protein